MKAEASGLGFSKEIRVSVPTMGGDTFLTGNASNVGPKKALNFGARTESFATKSYKRGFPRIRRGSRKPSPSGVSKTLTTTASVAQNGKKSILKSVGLPFQSGKPPFFSGCQSGPTKRPFRGSILRLTQPQFGTEDLTRLTTSSRSKESSFPDSISIGICASLPNTRIAKRVID
jgi:hypothetical protein